MSDIRINVQVVSQAAQASVSGLAREANKAEKGFKNLNVSIKQGSKFISSFAGNLAAIGVSKAIGLLSQGFGALTSSIFTSTQALETAATQFEVLTGSAGAANAIIKDLQEFTARTPFQFQGVAQAAQRLLSFGFSIDEVKTNLQDLGDVSAASGADIAELSLIFGQVRAAGKLTGERLLQLQERAIPIGPALAKSLGVAESSVRDLVSQGKVDFATFEAAFQSLNDTGEFAFGGIEKRSQTLQGRISTLKDNIELFSATIGERLAPALKAGVTALTEFIQRLGNNEQFQGFLDTIANNIPNAVRIMSQTFIGAIQIFNAFRVASGALVGVMFGLGSVILGTAEAALNLASAVGRFTGVDTAGIDKAKASIENLKNAAIDTAAEIKVNNDEINASEALLVENITAGTNAIIGKYEEEKAAAEATATATQDANIKKAEAVQQFRTLNELFALEDAEKKAQAREEEIATREAESEEDFQFLVTNLGKQEAARIAANAKKLENEGKTDQALKVLRDGRVKAETAAAKRQAEIDKKIADDKKNFFGNVVTIARVGNKSLFETAKKAQTAQAIIDGIASIQKAATIAPFPFNIPSIVAATALSVANINAIKAQKFQDGGVVGGNSFSGDNVFARVNSGEMILNRQQQATLFNMANNNSGSSGTQEITTVVQIGEEEVARAVSRSVANGFELGEGGV